MHKRIQLFSFLLLLCSFAISAQSTITGTVVDETGEPLIGVTIMPKESATYGTVTNIDGNYSIKVEKEATALIFKYVGFKDAEQAINGQSVIDVTMLADNFMLDQVVVSASKRKEKILNAPASVSIITSERITNQTSLTAVDNLKKTPGVDVMTTGLVSSNVNIRGFNDIFSGSMLTMVDNRIGRVPSLRVNAFQLIPGNNYDIDKMEVVRGPGSALYGPNAADGVLHILTKSPLDIDGTQETTLSFTAGLRRTLDRDWPTGSSVKSGEWQPVFKPAVRTAIKLNDKVGLKLSAKYMQGTDWENYDPREPTVGDVVHFGSVKNGGLFERDTTIASEIFDRDFSIENWNIDGRLDVRPTKNTEIIFNGGLSSARNMELTGLGGAQSAGWKYWYAQSRFRWKDLFVQYFVNSSNSGNETYLIPQVGESNTSNEHDFQLLTDRSKLHTVQIQHSSEPIDNLQLIYGADVLMTRPDTEGSINGRFEDSDNINQYGVYLQGEYDFTEKWKIVAASRVDYHDLIDEWQVSPRAGLVFKPHPKHTLRGTYNRAFSSPSSLALSLDLANGIHPLWNGVTNPFNPQGVEMNIRGIGNPVGYDYNFSEESGNLLYKNFWDGQMYELDNTANNHIYFQSMIDLVAAQLKAEAPANIQPLVDGLVAQLFDGMTGEEGQIQTADLAGFDFVEFLETGDHVGSLWGETGDLSVIKNRPNTKSSITQTWELGYKGIITDKLYLNADIFYTRKSNYSSPLLNISPLVGFNPNDLTTIMDSTLRNNLSETINGLVAPLFEGNEAYLVEANGDAYDEIVKIIQDANAQIGVGLVTPNANNDKVQDDMILTYVNLGTVDIWGFDIGGTYAHSKDMQAGFAYSYLSRDKIDLEGASGGFLGVNTPQHKVSASWDHFFPKVGIGYGINARWQDGFPANSAVYFGDVEQFHTVDLRVNYVPKWSKNTKFTIEVLNATGQTYRTFPGTPEIGTMGFFKINHTFK